MSFDTIIGHENIKKQIVKSIDNNTFSHAHILLGEDGIGKSIIARETAIKILGKKEYKRYVDIIEFKMLKKKKSIGINEIRDLIEEINKKPYEGDKKVIIIYKSDAMTIEAQNAFLKTIEEPPNGVYIILLCENSEYILDTIKSRCEIYKLQRLNKEEIDIFLNRNYSNISAQDKEYIIAFSDGIPGRIDMLLKNDLFKEIREISMNILKQIGKDQFKNKQVLLKYSSEWMNFLKCILLYVRDALIYKETENEKLLINLDKIYDLKFIAEKFSFNKLNKIINIINSTGDKLQKNVNVALTLEYMIFKLQEV